MHKIDDPKLYSSGYERKALDRYWTHPWMTKELFKQINIFDLKGQLRVWEPSAGRGDISKAIVAAGHYVYSTDIDMSEFDYRIGPGHERDFLSELELPIIDTKPVNAIIMNPPYSNPHRGIADDFIERGLEFFDREVYFMAALLRSEFASGKSKRRRLKFGECPHYLGEIVLTTRPRWDYGDPNAPKDAAPRHNFSWFLWRKDYRLDGTGVLRWFPKQIFSYMPKGFKP